MPTSGSKWRVAFGGSEMPVLEAYDLYRFYHAGEDENLALRGVSLHLHQGEIMALMGPSGTGKSTLLACLAGLDELDGGHVELMGRRLTRRPEAEQAALRAANIGVLLFDGLLAALAGIPTALVVATHDLAVAERMQRVWRLQRGTLETGAVPC